METGDHSPEGCQMEKVARGREETQRCLKDLATRSLLQTAKHTGISFLKKIICIYLLAMQHVGILVP